MTRRGGLSSQPSLGTLTDALEEVMIFVVSRGVPTDLLDVSKLILVISTYSEITTKMFLGFYRCIESFACVMPFDWLPKFLGLGYLKLTHCSAPTPV